MAAGGALVGDFANGCTLFVREGANVRLSDSDQDDFVRNRATLLGEGRFALAVWSPASFVTVDLSAPRRAARSAVLPPPWGTGMNDRSRGRRQHGPAV